MSVDFSPTDEAMNKLKRMEAATNMEKVGRPSNTFIDGTNVVAVFKGYQVTADGQPSQEPRDPPYYIIMDDGNVINPKIFGETSPTQEHLDAVSKAINTPTPV